MIINALNLGPEAAALGITQGRVLAVLRQAVYLESQEGLIVGVVGAEAPDGPLSLRVANFPALHPELTRLEGAPFETTTEMITIAGRVRLNLAAGRRWVPDLPWRVGPAAAQREAAATLSALLTAAGSDAGAARLAPLLPNLILGGPEPAVPRLAALDDAVLHRIAARIIRIRMAGAARDWVSGTQALTELLGLGPGLTPTGDDVAMGLLAALVWQAPALHATRRMQALAQAVCKVASRRTTRLSIRLLRHAAAGMLYAPAIDLGAALLAGQPDAVAAPARQLFAIGSTSGADLAVGLLAGILMGAEWRNHPL